MKVLMISLMLAMLAANIFAVRSSLESREVSEIIPVKDNNVECKWVEVKENDPLGSRQNLKPSRVLICEPVRELSGNYPGNNFLNPVRENLIRLLNKLNLD